jgi:hypothetical protein
MTSVRLASVAVAALLGLLLPDRVDARPWQGIDPGKSTGEEVVAKFGEPTTRKQRGAKAIIAYKGERALPGTKEVQFACRTDGVVEEITVFLAVPLDGDSIEGTYGKPQAKTFTDTFQKVWQYPQKGVTVYFDKDGTVQAITFSPSAPKAGEAKAAAKKAPPPEKAAAPEPGDGESK